MDEKLWDLSTVTTADFTVDIEIPNEVWPRWKAYKRKVHEEHKADREHVHTPIRFQDLFINELHEQMKKTKPVFSLKQKMKCGNVLPEAERIKIASISFGFAN